jgi:Icc-related predicted phosphoesterase
MRLAAVADLHCPRTPPETVSRFLEPVADAAEVLVLCGDLTDRGLEDEARALARALTTSVRIPILAVLGNHDYDAGQADVVKTILTDAGVRILDGDSVELRGVGFVGVKGFAGGFGARALQPWGEAAIKAFVREAVDEALKLESALAKLTVGPKVALLHYAPIEATTEGEAPEILPFLGSSRLEEPLTHHAVTAVVHGHAHHGSPDGRTRGNVPVYNVALPVLQRVFPDRPPFRVIELPGTWPVVGAPPSAPTSPAAV